MVEKSAPFAVRSTDVHTVLSALSAAERSWKRGETAAVLRWVQRAAEAASEAEDDARALELAKCARELAKQLPVASRRPVLSLATETPQPSPPSSVHLLTKLAQPRTVPDPPPASVPPSSAGEVTRGRHSSPFEEDTNQVAIFKLRADAARTQAMPAPRQPNPHEDLTRVSSDAWESETVTGQSIALDPDSDVSPPTRGSASAPPRKAHVPSTAAIRVLLWRDPDGALYVTTAGAPAPPHAIEAVLTALDPDTDLVGLLEDPT